MWLPNTKAFKMLPNLHSFQGSISPLFATSCTAVLLHEVPELCEFHISNAVRRWIKHRPMKESLSCFITVFVKHYLIKKELFLG